MLLHAAFLMLDELSADLFAKVVLFQPTLHYQADHVSMQFKP